MTTGLRRFRTPPQPAPGENQPAGARCEMCGEAIGPEGEHGHVADLVSRGIRCACRPCYLLFTQDGAGAARFCAIPERYRYTARFELSPAVWDTMGIPVRMAFFFRNSAEETTVAFYPSPAGATECLLPLEQWQQVLAANPAFAEARDDVEALLLNREREEFECFLVPIDECYRLVGLVKLYWRGFDGGAEAWEAIEAFFADLRSRSERVGEATEHG
jgi:hypothetical protein